MDYIFDIKTSSINHLLIIYQISSTIYKIYLYYILKKLYIKL